jgi:hypothetical protein
MKKGKVKIRGDEVEFDVPDGIIAHLTRECGGNAHHRHVAEVTCGSFEKETYEANPHSGAYDNLPRWAARNAADLETDSRFHSAYHGSTEDSPHTRNNWVCYLFKERRIMLTHHAIRASEYGPGTSHLKSSLVETSVDGESWREVAREEDNEQLNGKWFSGTSSSIDAGGGSGRRQRVAGPNRDGRPGQLSEQLLSMRRVRSEAGVPH